MSQKYPILLYWSLNYFLFYYCGKTPWLRQLAEGRVYLGLRLQKDKSRSPLRRGNMAAGSHSSWSSKPEFTFLILKHGAEIAHQRWWESAFRAAAMTMCRHGSSVWGSKPQGWWWCAQWLQGAFFFTLFLKGRHLVLFKILTSYSLSRFSK